MRGRSKLWADDPTDAVQEAKVLFGADGIVAATVAITTSTAKHGPDVGGKFGDLFVSIGAVCGRQR
jgi:hypothetical protein